MHYTTIDLLVLESSAKNTQDVLISELVVSVQEFDGICLREVGDRVRQNNIDYEKCQIQNKIILDSGACRDRI